MVIEPYKLIYTLQWHHNEHNGDSNHQCLNCLLNRLFYHKSNKTSKHCITGLCEGNSLLTSEFPTQRASNSENVSSWWRHDHFRVTFASAVFLRTNCNQIWYSNCLLLNQCYIKRAILVLRSICDLPLHVYMKWNPSKHKHYRKILLKEVKHKMSQKSNTTYTCS